MTCKPLIGISALYLVFAPTVQAQNLVMDGGFNGPTATSPWERDGGWGLYPNNLGWGGSNLAYSAAALAVAPTSRAGGAYLNNNQVTESSIKQSVSGLSIASASAGGDLTIWYSTYWSEGVGTGQSAGSQGTLTVSLNGVEYATYMTNDGYSAAPTYGTMNALNGAILDTGTLGSNEWLGNTAIRSALTLTNYSGPDTAELSFTYTADGTNAADDVGIDNVIIVAGVVPEPSSTVLLGLGALGLLARRKR